ncbi:unnamed protein product [Rotaria sp. Silwood2]|nr:unnamed protein product [Rotaria sp. Silwood2]CAF4430597.1 unnamed protein product [Rotaria sp. Silwood2]
MAALKCLSTAWSSLVAVFHPTQRDNIASELPLFYITSATSRESDWERLRKEIDTVGVYDLHNLLRQRNRLEWSEWHLAIDKNAKAIEIAKNFHQEFKKSKLSSSVASKVDMIEKTFLEYMPTNNEWNKIRISFQEARKKNSPLPIIKAYTISQEFSKRINKHSAANTYHALKLYCTLVNCPVLAQTQEYTEAITSLLFHPDLDKFLVRNKTVYRGTVLEDEKLIASYK